MFLPFLFKRAIGYGLYHLKVESSNYMILVLKFDNPSNSLFAENSRYKLRKFAAFITLYVK